MKKRNSIFKSRRTKIWAITSLLLTITLLAANGAAVVFSDIISIAMGGRRAVLVDEASAEAVDYYETSTASKSEANENAAKVTQEIAEEGFVLLKNADGALPLPANASVSVFGKNSVNLVYGGSGSGGGDTTFEKKTLYDSLEATGIAYNPELKAFYENNEKSGSERESNPSDLDTGKAIQAIKTGEPPYAAYIEQNISYAGYTDAAIVVISRVGGEGFDLPRSEAYGAKHYLDLDANERDLLQSICDSGMFDRVIVILNTLNVMETGFLDEYNGEIDACIWIGGPGLTGIMALGEILNGDVTPSGHTTDTWPYDLTKDPTWNNFSNRGVENGDNYFVDGAKKNYWYVNYEENIYVGYRYYETRAYEESLMNGDDSWYAENVAFPFGYGLSYTNFEWQLADSSSIEHVSIDADGQYSVTVQVTNTGAYKGKDVVQLYAKLHYNEGGLEKAYEGLCGFEKTPMLYPLASNAVNPEDAANDTDKPNSCLITLTFTPYDIASYDYKGLSGFTGYVIEAGDDYALFVSSDAHTPVFRIPFAVDSDIPYPVDPVTGHEVVNLYTDQADSAYNSDTMIADSLMSRMDLSQLPDAYQEGDGHVSNEFIAQLKDLSPNNQEAASWTMPTQGAAATLVLADILQQNEDGTYSADYSDPRWDAILDALTVDEMVSLFNEGAFKTNGIDRIGKPQTLESDGPVGWCNFISITDQTWKGNNVYTSQVVMSATWNKDLIQRVGACIGEEALWGADSTDGRTYSGWYAPGINIHRSQFGGRNFEYFSEDSYLTGMMAASLIKGCSSKGVYTYVKHFALNEQETHRGGGSSWVTEQAMREIYLKPFEYAVKEGKTTAIMSSFTRIGTKWAGGDYRLLTEILRNEWGFKGTVICDYNEGNNYMDARQMIYAGGDLNLCSAKARMWSDYDPTSAADVTALRKAAKNILYTVANSNAMNNTNYVYRMPVWQEALIILDCAVVGCIVIWGILAIRSTRRKTKAASTDAE